MSLEDEAESYIANHEAQILKPNVEKIKFESIAITKRKTLDSLLAKIQQVSLKQVCKSLGWQPTENSKGAENPPTQSNYKVAIVDELLRTAKLYNWHLALDGGIFYIYTGCLWIDLDKDELKNFLKQVAIRQGYPIIKARDSKFINNLYDQAIQDSFFTDKEYSPRSLINLNNCTLVLNSDGVTTKDFDYKDFLTHQLPFDYVPNVINPIFSDYLNTVLPDTDTQRTLQETCGYLFIKGLKLEKIFFLFGQGANGKSVLFEVINGLIGELNISHYSLESLTDENGYYRAKIKDKIVNYGTDIKLSKIDAGMFKTLASGEPIEARLPYCEPFIMSGYAKLIFNVNRLDNANIEHTHGFYRRILIIPFNTTIAETKQDKNLHKKILENKAGVLNWIIQGAKQVINNEDIFVSNECRQFKEKFLKEADNVALFLEYSGYQYCSYSKELLSTLYEEYKEFCSEDGYKALGKTNFSKRLVALGHDRIKADGNKDYFRLKPTYMG